MFITDPTKEFYNIIAGQRVLVLVHADLDAICSAKILQALFRADHILYSLCPILTHSDLLQAFHTHKDQVGCVVLVNCGGTLDLIEFLQPRPDLPIFVADTHRPLHVCNIYSGDQVRILSQLEDDEEVPAFDDIFRDDEDSSESDDEEEGGEGARGRLEARLEKRRERRLWDQRKNKLVFDYAQYSYYAGSTATLMFELAWKLSKDTNDLLWLAIIGLVSEGLCSRREQHKLTLASVALNTHVARLNHATAGTAAAAGEDDNAAAATDNIAFHKDVQLILYRHWSVMDSLMHSPYTATALKLWTDRGKKRMMELLAELGLPLIECQQLFVGMDVHLRTELPTLLEGKAAKYGLDKLVCPSFTRTHSFHSRCSAADFAHAALALLEPTTSSDLTPSQAFLKASDSLAGSKLFQTGISHAKLQLEAIYNQMKTFLDMNQVISAGPFLYATVPQSAFFSGPHVLGVLGRFTLAAHVAVSRNKKARSLPLVLTAPHSKHDKGGGDGSGGDDAATAEAAQQDWCLVCGVPPVADHSHRNLFGKAFEQAVEKSKSRAELEYFDTHVIRLNVADRSKFFDALIHLLS